MFEKKVLIGLGQTQFDFFAGLANAIRANNSRYRGGVAAILRAVLDGVSRADFDLSGCLLAEEVNIRVVNRLGGVRLDVMEEE